MGLIPKPAPSLERIKMIQGINEERYWRELKHKYAGMIMQGMCANPQWDNDTWAQMADHAINAATALVERLKEESK